MPCSKNSTKVSQRISKKRDTVINTMIAPEEITTAGANLDLTEHIYNLNVAYLAIQRKWKSNLV